MRCAFYEKDITPPLGCYMSGYYRDIRADDVLEPLFARCAVFESNGECAVIIEIDACEYHNELHDKVTERIEEYTKIPAKNVLISANHTHRGIPVYDSPEINAYADAAYCDVVYRLIADCAILAYKRLYEADLSFGKSYAKGISFNRNFVMKDGTYRTNVPRSERDYIEKTLDTIDEEVPVLFVNDKDGNPKGCLVSFACHNDVTGGNVYGGGFSSILTKELKKKYGNDFVCVFVPGTCADINHINIFSEKTSGQPVKKTYIKMGEVLADAVCDAYKNSKPITQNTLWSKKELIKIPRRRYTREDLFESIKEFCEFDKEPVFVRNILYYDVANNEDDMDVYVQCVKIGDVLVFGYSGEIFVRFGLDLKKAVSSDKVIIATIANGYCGYVPTKEAFAPNSHLYEKKLCMGSCLCEDAGYIMTERLIEMSKD